MRSASAAVLVLMIISGTGCISWNVHTSITAEFYPDGSMDRRGNIVLKQYDKGNDEEVRHQVEIDTVEARAYIEKNYVSPEGTEFKGFVLNPDSSYSVSWELEVEDPRGGFRDYTRLASDSTQFSGNRVTASKKEDFFSTKYEYNETFFNTINADSIITVLPEILPRAEKAFFRYLERYAPSRSAGSALGSARDSLAVTIKNFWDTEFSRYLYDPSVLEKGSDYFESLRDSTVNGIYGILSSHPGGSGYSRKMIEDALKTGDDEIDDQLTDRGIHILGAYNVFGDDTYTFNVRLKLPGRLEVTNADSADGEYLVWSFSNIDFHSHELLLFARSSEFRWGRLILGLFIVLIALVAVVLLARNLAAS
jgi:hypothetical protein